MKQTEGVNRRVGSGRGCQQQLFNLLRSAKPRRPLSGPLAALSGGGVARATIALLAWAVVPGLFGAESISKAANAVVYLGLPFPALEFEAPLNGSRPPDTTSLAPDDAVTCHWPLLLTPWGRAALRSSIASNARELRPLGRR